MSQSIPEAFRAAAKQHPDQTIVWHPESPLTFAQLDQDSDRVAAALHARGLTARRSRGAVCDQR